MRDYKVLMITGCWYSIYTKYTRSRLKFHDRKAVKREGWDVKLCNGLADGTGLA